MQKNNPHMLKIRKLADKSGIILLAIITLVYIIIAISSHNHFLTYGWDLGYFDQLIWKISHGFYPYSTLSEVNILAGHFSPILFLFAPFYLIWPNPKMLLILQAAVMVFAAWPLYILAQSKTHDRFISVAIISAYLFFIGTQWSILNEFHEITVTPLLITFVYLSLEKRNNRMLLISVILLFLVKEELALLNGSFGLMMIFAYRRIKEGLTLFIFSVLFFFFLTNVFMPAVSEKGVYQHLHLSNEAKSPSDFLVKSITDPVFAIKSLVTPKDKIYTLGSSLFSFAFIPVFAPIGILFPLFEQFLTRFLYTGPQYTYWQNVNHHAAPAAILLAIASIYGTQNLLIKFKSHKKEIHKYLPVFLFTVVVIQDIYFKAPIHSIFKKQLYTSENWMRDDYLIIDRAEKIPANIPIAAQNSIFPHLSHREKIYLLPNIYDAEYIIVDLHDGPNKYAPLSHKEMENFVSGLVTAKKFKLFIRQNDTMILKKI